MNSLPVSPHVSCTREPRNRHSSEDVVSPRLGRGKHCLLQPACVTLPNADHNAQGNTAGSPSPRCSPGSPGLFLQSFFSASPAHVIITLTRGVITAKVQKWTSCGCISWGSSLLISPACWGPSQWQTTISYTSSSSQCCIISRLAELTLCPIIQVFNKDIKKHWSLGHSSSDWSLAVHHATDHNPLNLIFQLVLGRMVRHYSPLQISDNSNHLCSFRVWKWFPELFATLLWPFWDRDEAGSSFL